MTTIVVEDRQRPMTPASDDRLRDIAKDRPNVSALLAFKEIMAKVSPYFTPQRPKIDIRSRPPKSNRQQNCDPPPALGPPATLGRIVSYGPVLSQRSNEQTTVPENLSVSQPAVALPIEVSRDSSVSESGVVTKNDTHQLQVAKRSVCPDFERIDQDLYQAIKIAVPRIYQTKWDESWKDIIKGRLMKLGLENSISGLSLCMVSQAASSQGMQATIVVYCESSDKRKIVKDLAPFVKSYVRPPSVALRVIAEDILFSSGDPMSPSTSVPLDKSGQQVRISSDFQRSKTQPSLLGVSMNIVRNGSVSDHSSCTIGGVIQIGDKLFALSVGHSLWSSPSKDFSHSSDNTYRLVCGFVEHAQWSQNQMSSEGENYSRSEDWMTIKLKPEFRLPNYFRHPEENSNAEQVQSIVKKKDLVDGDVWVCGGVSGTQAGYLSSSSSSILYGNAEYSVLSISLQRPLAAGDSGSWVVRDNKLCGYIIARLNNKARAYMLPIEPVFEDIEKYIFRTTGLKLKAALPEYSTNHHGEVKLTTPEDGKASSPLEPVSSEFEDNSPIIHLNCGGEGIDTSPSDLGAQILTQPEDVSESSELSGYALNIESSDPLNNSVQTHADHSSLGSNTSEALERTNLISQNLPRLSSQAERLQRPDGVDFTEFISQAPSQSSQNPENQPPIGSKPSHQGLSSIENFLLDRNDATIFGLRRSVPDFLLERDDTTISGLRRYAPVFNDEVESTQMDFTLPRYRRRWEIIPKSVIRYLQFFGRKLLRGLLSRRFHVRLIAFFGCSSTVVVFMVPGFPQSQDNLPFTLTLFGIMLMGLVIWARWYLQPSSHQQIQSTRHIYDLHISDLDTELQTGQGGLSSSTDSAIDPHFRMLLQRYRNEDGGPLSLYSEPQPMLEWPISTHVYEMPNLSDLEMGYTLSEIRTSPQGDFNMHDWPQATSRQ